MKAAQSAGVATDDTLGGTLKAIRGALGLRRTEVAHTAGLSLYIIAGLEDGTLAYTEPYLRFVAAAYRVDDYAARRNGDGAT